MMELFMNDKYKLLKLLYENQTIILGEKVVPLRQVEIAQTLKFSKMKTNAIFVELQEQGLIKQEARGKYTLTEKAEKIVKYIEKINDIK